MTIGRFPRSRRSLLKPDLIVVGQIAKVQFGHSKDHRPDLPQVKVMQAVLDPLGMPLATDVVAGSRADEGVSELLIPCQMGRPNS